MKSNKRKTFKNKFRKRNRKTYKNKPKQNRKSRFKKMKKRRLTKRKQKNFKGGFLFPGYSESYDSCKNICLYPHSLEQCSPEYSTNLSHVNPLCIKNKYGTPNFNKLHPIYIGCKDTCQREYLCKGKKLGSICRHYPLNTKTGKPEKKYQEDTTCKQYSTNSKICE